MSVYFEQDQNLEGPDPRVLEMKIHYLIGMLAKAGILLDKDGKPCKAVTSDVQQDADTVQATVDPKNFL